MSEFNTKANRLMQASLRDYMNILRKFIAFLETTEIIKEYIDRCGGYDLDIEEGVKEIHRDHNKYFTLGDTEEDEVKIVYSLIKYMSVHYEEVPIMIIFAYSDSNKYADKLKAFNERFVMALISNISEHLKKVGIRMGMDENVVYNVNGNQVNIANDNATINAVQNNGCNADELKVLIKTMREGLSSDLPCEDIHDANNSIDIIENELVSGNPNEEKVKTHFNLLKRIDSGVKFANACCGLLTFANRFYPFLEQIVPWFQTLV